MHALNRAWWKICESTYTSYFRDPSVVVEFGSYNINGSIRDHFICSRYTGIDWRPGPCVDIVSLAHDAPFLHNSIDTIASASMLEHDPFWQESITCMVSLLKTSGILLLSWGAAKNPVHCLAEAPDGHFHSLKAGQVINLLEKMNMYVHDFRYECHLQDKTPSNVVHNCGEVCLVAFKNKNLAIGNRFIDNLLEEDKD